MRRTILSCLSLEARDNPSGPDIADPYGTNVPPPDPTITLPVYVVSDTMDVATGAGAGIGDVVAPSDTTGILGINSVYKVPLLESTLGGPNP